MKSNKEHSRRQFLKLSASATAGAMVLGSLSLSAKNSVSQSPKLNISIFSKHLQFLNYTDMAEVAKEIGFDGVDLTVRPGGHVQPETVQDQLPLAADALQKSGLLPNMFTSNVIDASVKESVQVLETASQLGFKVYRTDWLKYKNKTEILSNLRQFNLQLKNLAELNKKLKIQGAYQNHAGTSVGSPVWDIDQLLDGILPNELGCQYDIRHATAEGGNSWELGFQLIKDHINSIVIKDFKWEVVNGKWKPVSTPLGEGMVDFDAYFQYLKQYEIHVPVSLHYEYELGGVENGSTNPTMRHKEIYQIMKKDLAFLRNKWESVQINPK